MINIKTTYFQRLKQTVAYDNILLQNKPFNKLFQNVYFCFLRKFQRYDLWTHSFNNNGFLRENTCAKHSQQNATKFVLY